MIKILDPSGRMAVIDEPVCSLERFKRQVGTTLGFESASLERVELSCKGRPLIDDGDIGLLGEGDTVLCFLKPKKCVEIPATHSFLRRWRCCGERGGQSLFMECTEPCVAKRGNSE